MKISKKDLEKFSKIDRKMSKVFPIVAFAICREFEISNPRKLLKEIEIFCNWYLTKKELVPLLRIYEELVKEKNRRGTLTEDAIKQIFEKEAKK